MALTKIDKQNQKTLDIRRQVLFRKIIDFNDKIRNLYQAEYQKFYNKTAKKQPINGKLKEGVTLNDPKQRNAYNSFIEKTEEKVALVQKQRDSFTKNYITREFEASYWDDLYTAAKKSEDPNKMPKFLKSQLEETQANEFSTISDPKQFTTKQKQERQKVKNTITSSVKQGQGIKEVNTNIDIAIGFRDSTGRIIPKSENKRGITWQNLLVAYSVIKLYQINGRYSSVERYENLGAEIKNVYVATLDDRTRPQSASMDGQVGRQDGTFRYPDGNYYRIKNTGNPAWDINDRCTFIQEIEGFEPGSRRARLLNSQPRERRSEVLNRITFDEWAKLQGLTRNKYGQYYKL